MKKRYPFAIYQNLLVAARRENTCELLEGCDEILAFISERHATGKDVRVSDLVYQRDFGTSQTVNRKCSLLINNGFLQFSTLATDKRVKILSLTAKSENFLAERSKLMSLAFSQAK